MTATESSDHELYKLWTARDPVDVGAVVFIAHYLATGVDPMQWQRETDRLEPRVRAILEAHGEADAVEAMMRARRIIANALMFASDEIEGRPRPTSETNAILMAPLSAETQRVVKEAEEPTAAIATPFPDLNYHLLGGFRPGELCYLGGRPSVGKSALATEIIRHVAEKHRCRSLIVSCETTNLSTCRRVMAQTGRLDAAGLRTGKSIDWPKTTATAARLYDVPLWLTDQVRSVADLRSGIALHGPFGLIVVDYLQLLIGPRQKEGRRIEIEHISSELKSLAVTHRCALLVLSSLSRIKDGERPTLASLRESGNLEHDADIVLLLHRENERSEERQLIVAKNRDGRTGVVRLNFRPQWVGFEEQTDEDES